MRTKNNTEQNKISFLKALRASLGVITAACEASGINRNTYYLWCKDDPQFVIDCNEVELYQFDFVENALMKKIKEGAEPSIHFYLKTKGKRKGYGTEVNVNANLSGKIDLKGLIGFDDEEDTDTE